MQNLQCKMQNRKSKTLNSKHKIFFYILLVLSFILSGCATVHPDNPYVKTKPTKQDEETYSMIRIVSTFAGTVIGGTLGFLATSSENDGTKTILSSAGGALAGTAIGWFGGQFIGDYMRDNKRFDDKKLDDNMDDYRMIRDINKNR